jgi:hypothetical protein
MQISARGILATIAASVEQNATNDHVLWVKILHITTIRGLLSNRKLDNK